MADELDDIIQRMIDAGESEENIATVIQSFDTDAAPNPMAGDAANAAAQARAQAVADQPFGGVLGQTLKEAGESVIGIPGSVYQLAKKVTEAPSSGAPRSMALSLARELSAQPIAAASQAIEHPETILPAFREGLASPEVMGGTAANLALSILPSPKVAALAKPAAGPIGRGVAATGRGLEALGQSGPIEKVGKYGAAYALYKGDPVKATGLVSLPYALQYGGKGLQHIGKGIERLSPRHILDLDPAPGTPNPNWRTAAGPAEPFTPVDVAAPQPGWQTATTQAMESPTGANRVPTADYNMDWRTATDKPSVKMGLSDDGSLVPRPTAPVITHGGRIADLGMGTANASDLVKALRSKSPAIRQAAEAELNRRHLIRNPQ
jgi:hypothetical protein